MSFLNCMLSQVTYHKYECPNTTASTFTLLFKYHSLSLTSGYNMGIRIIDEFLAKSGVESCKDFSETVQSIAKIALKMFLGVNADISKQSADGSMLGKITAHNILRLSSPSLFFEEHPIAFSMINEMVVHE